ncbi:UNVERIFIED_CONTAM: hypothetical protein Sradi_5874800 [Sesamum radiatum]|uniref:Secreted protein n=1 Tax=Sesamum radiatum TaxID=300843 RepID=A0AAW2KTF7_SESRA
MLLLRLWLSWTVRVFGGGFLGRNSFAFGFLGRVFGGGFHGTPSPFLTVRVFGAFLDGTPSALAFLDGEGMWVLGKMVGR